MLPPLLVLELVPPDTVLPESVELDVEPDVSDELEPDVDDEVEPDVSDELEPEVDDVDELASDEDEDVDESEDDDELAFVACAACSAKMPRPNALAAATSPVTILMREVNRLLFMVQPSPRAFSGGYEKPFDFL